MANTIYPKYKQALLDSASNSDLNDGTVMVALVDTGTYTYSASDEFLSDLSGIVGTAQEITNTTVANGLLDGDDVTFPSVTGNAPEALVIYIDTGAASTSRLVSFMDTNVSLPVTPNGGDIAITWNASGIFQL